MPDPKEFAGQVAIVTGGGTGLGLEIATRLGQAGATVACLSRDREHHQELIGRGHDAGFTVVSETLDLRDDKAVRRVVRGLARDLGRIDVLVNNAAGNFIRPSLTLAPKAFATVIDIALNGAFYMSREVGRVMQRQGSGAIVNISAPYAGTGKPGVVHSACAKAGVEAMTKTLAAEWAPLGIRINAVSPGPFVSEGAGDRLWPSAELEEAVRASIPLGRFGRAAEIAELVLFLASPRAAWVTGSVLLADGGWSLPGSFADGRIDRRR
ncbi:MAG: SDR family oxidoreductase [Planctomycetes bacterium]|nr:SDR family oxidoreductase [Planctomycetota bacterium]